MLQQQQAVLRFEAICELTSFEFADEHAWNDELDDKLMPAAYDAVKEGGRKELEKLKGMFSWRANVFMDMRSQFVAWPSDTIEQEGLDRWCQCQHMPRISSDGKQNPETPHIRSSQGAKMSRKKKASGTKIPCVFFLWRGQQSQ